VSSTQQIARRYYDAWTSGDSDTVVALLSPDFTFAAGDMRIDGREAFLDGRAFPSDATVTMVAEAYQDDVAFADVRCRARRWNHPGRRAAHRPRREDHRLGVRHRHGSLHEVRGA
jgi:ketosteroid isomerase-like protein